MTQAQKTASHPNHSVWVSASAGTGKTKVLTDRVLRLLLQGVPPEKILCLTFTTAAATEMAARIQKRLGEWVTLPESALIRQLGALTGEAPAPALVMRVRTLFAEILDSSQGLNIQTIHSFCQSLISQFPLEAGIQPHSQLLDDDIARALLEEAKSRLLRGLYHHEDRRIEEAIRVLSWRQAESSFAELLEEIINKSSRFAYLFQHYSLTELEARIYTTLQAIAGLSPEEVVARYCDNEEYAEKSKTLAKALLEGTSAEAEKGRVLAEFLALPLTQRIEHYAKYAGVFLTKDGEPRKKILNTATVKRYPEAEQAFFDIQESVLRVEEGKKAQLCAELSCHVLHIAEGLLAIYQDIKAQRGSMDYNDLIHIGTSLLKNADAAEWILYKLDGGIDHILVDEAQDTSPAQWDIVKALSAEFFAGDTGKDTSRSLFVVGDEKQSIYSFQGADPQKFHAMLQEFSSRAKEAMISWQEVPLDCSFRSTDAVLNIVDAVFASAVLQKAISPSMQVQHVAHRQGQAGLVELWRPFIAEKKEKTEPWPLPILQQANQTSASQYANKIADTIAGWLQSGRILTAKNRPVQASDIMILVRRRGQLVDEVIQALKKRHIPVSGADRMILTDQIAIMDLIALGKFLLLPQDDLTLATVLKTPLLGLSEEDIFTLAYGRGERNLWAMLKYQASSHLHFYQACDYLAALLKRVDIDTPFAIFHDILEAKGGRKSFIQRLGHEVNDPLDEFLSLAQSYEQSNTPSLQGFLHWLEHSSVEIKRDMEQGANQVRVMTIHGSKGLQAPIVFLPDTTQVPRTQEQLLWADGFAFWSGKADNRSQVYNTLYEEGKTQEKNEYYRLLYVALTRAEDELYIGGYYHSEKLPAGCWYEVIQEGMQSLTATERYETAEPGEVVLRFATQQQAPIPEGRDTIAVIDRLPLPKYLLEEAPSETVLRHVQPSLVNTIDTIISPLAEAQGKAVLRGTIIHRLLEFLPALPPEHRQAKAQHMLLYYKDAFSADIFSTLEQDVMALLGSAYADFLFSPDSQAEVAVAGIVNGQQVMGRIDRLIVTRDDVWIVDYKTTPYPPAKDAVIPSPYREQLALYKALVAPLYPGKAIRCALLWTANLMLMEVPGL